MALNNDYHTARFCNVSNCPDMYSFAHRHNSTPEEHPVNLRQHPNETDAQYNARIIRTQFNPVPWSGGYHHSNGFMFGQPINPHQTEYRDPQSRYIPSGRPDMDIIQRANPGIRRPTFQPPTHSPINTDANETAELYLRLREECEDATLVMYFWLNQDYLHSLAACGEYDNGYWHDNSAHIHRGYNGDIVVSTSSLSITYTRTQTNFTVTDGDNKTITKEIIHSGLIPILELLSHVCKTSHTPQSANRQSQGTNFNRSEYRKRLKRILQDDDAFELIDAPISLLIDVLESSYDSHTSILGENMNTVDISVPHIASNIQLVICSSGFEVEVPTDCHTLGEAIVVDNYSQITNIAEILDTIYAWAMTNDLTLV